MQKNRAEVLAPAGSYEGVCAAVSAGADAIYLGGTAFSARKFAKNLTDDEIARAALLCKEHGVKLYVTVNTILTDRELPQALAFCKMLKEAGADAVIIQDLGLAALLKEYVPALELHASTQMTVCSLDGAKKLADMGFTRVVLARELSVEQIKYITENCGIETEVFVHGALCYSYSGQCLMSAVIGRRSGNRGACAGPCRLSYKLGGKNGYFLSLKDLCLADKVAQLSAMGVASLKIEGRMKRAEYTAAVTRVYADAAKGKAVTERDIQRLAKIFSRDGFTNGYYCGKKGSSMLGKKGEEDGAKALFDAEKHAYMHLYRKIYNAAAPAQDVAVAEQFVKSKLGQKRKFTKYQIISVCKTAAQANAAYEKSARVYLPVYELAKLGNKEKAGVAFPVILPDNEKVAFVKRLSECGAKYAYVHNIGQLDIAKSLGMEVYLSSSMNIYNSSAARMLGAEYVTLSAEISAPQARDIAKNAPVGMLAYGRIRLMLTENCVVRGSEQCDGTKCRLPQKLYDRAGEGFLVLPAGNCRNEIYNGKVLWLADKLSDIRALSLSHIELDFTDESAARVSEVIASYTGGEKLAPREYTRGMFDKKMT